MKMYRVVLVLALLLNAAFVQAAGEPLKVILHINDGYKITHLANSVQNIRKELGKDVDIKVVVNGKAVTQLLKSNTENAKIVQSILKQNVPIVLCHSAVLNNRVDKNLLIEGLVVLKTDGNVAVLNYQRQGYIYIKM